MGILIWHGGFGGDSLDRCLLCSRSRITSDRYLRFLPSYVLTARLLAPPLSPKWLSMPFDAAWCAARRSRRPLAQWDSSDGPDRVWHVQPPIPSAPAVDGSIGAGFAPDPVGRSRSSILLCFHNFELYAEYRPCKTTPQFGHRAGDPLRLRRHRSTGLSRFRATAFRTQFPSSRTTRYHTPPTALTLRARLPTYS